MAKSRTEAQSTLREALARKAAVATHSEIASAAGVSTRSISQVLKGKFATGPKPPSPQSSRISRKQLIGYVETLSRLALYLGLDPSKTVHDYQIEPGRNGVAEAINRVRKERSPELRPRTDPVLDQITARENKVRIGVFDWEPWKRRGEDVERSWAYRYLRRLVRCVSPDFEFLPAETGTDIQWIFTAFTGRHIDLVLGAYETPQRRRRGLDFIHVPGLGVPLAGLTLKHRGKGFDFEEVFDPQLKLPKPPRFLAIRHEVGHLFLAGASGRDEDVTIIDKTTAEAVAGAFLDSLGDYSTWPVLIADATTIEGVQGYLNGLKSSDKRLVDVEFEKLGDKPINPFAPVYRLSIAVPADAVVWREMLQVAQAEELFRNAPVITAKAYAELLARLPRLRVIPFGDDIRPSVAQAFAEACIHELQELRNLRNDRSLEEIIEAIRSQWLPETSRRLAASIKQLNDRLDQLLKGRLQTLRES